MTLPGFRSSKIFDFTFLIIRSKSNASSEDSICTFETHTNQACSCADPEIFMRGGPTKMVIFGHRRGGSNPPKIPKLPFLGKISKFQGGGRTPGPPPPSGSAHDACSYLSKQQTSCCQFVI